MEQKEIMKNTLKNTLFNELQFYNIQYCYLCDLREIWQDIESFREITAKAKTFFSVHYHQHSGCSSHRTWRTGSVFTEWSCLPPVQSHWTSGYRTGNGRNIRKPRCSVRWTQAAPGTKSAVVFRYSFCWICKSGRRNAFPIPLLRDGLLWDYNGWKSEQSSFTSQNSSSAG